MNWLVEKDAIILVCGVKLIKSKKLFKKDTQTYLYDGGESYKMNAAAGVLYALKESNYRVIAQGINKEDADILCRQGIIESGDFFAHDIRDKKQSGILAKEISRIKTETTKAVHVVQYGAASGLADILPNGSLRHDFWDTPAESLLELIRENCVSLINVIQALHEENIFQDQKITKIISISAVAAIRPLPKLALDNVQKAALHSLLRTMAIELIKENIFITEILPGSTDGGYYDNPSTVESSLEESSKIGFEYTIKNKPMFTADKIGQSVKHVLDSDFNIREIILIPYGQYPQLGA